MDNETAQLHAIIADVTQMRFRYLENRERVDPLTFGRLVAQEVIRRMDEQNLVVASRFIRGGSI